MNRKIDEITNPGSTLNQAEPTEPVFVFRAITPGAAVALRAWAKYLERQGNNQQELIKRARDCAQEMDDWSLAKYMAAKENK